VWRARNFAFDRTVTISNTTPLNIGFPETEPLTMPLTPLFKEGVVVAIQCLENFAMRLGGQKTGNA